MQTSFRSLLALPLLLALSACGGEEATVIDPELGLDGPTTLTLVPGTTLSHDFSLQRNETANGPVTLTIDGLPEGVTASFEPATVSGDAVDTTLRLEAQRSAPRGVSLVTLRAVGGEELIAERSFALEVRGITVEGRLLSSYGNAPPYPTRVVIDGQPTMSDDLGRFTVQDVALPYDLVVLGEEVVEIFEGATHPSPTIRGAMMEPRVEIDAAITGTVSPLPETGEAIVVCATPHEGAFAPVCVTASQEDGEYGLPLYLASPFGVTDVRVVARRVMQPEDAPQHFTGYAEQTLSVAGGTTVEASLTLQTSASTHVELAAVPPPGGDDPFFFGAWQAFGETIASEPFFDPDAPAVAVADGGVAVVLAMSETDTHQYGVLQLVRGPEDANITFPTATPEFASPDEDAILGPDTVFGVSGAESGLTTHLFEFDGASMLFHTARASFTFPDVSRIAPGLTAENLGWWSFLHLPEMTDIDAALDGPFGYGLIYSMVANSGTGSLPGQTTKFVSAGEGRAFHANTGPLSLPTGFGFLAQ